MNPTKLRTPEQRVGILPNGALPPPDPSTTSTEALLHRALVEGDDAALEVVVHDLRPEMLRLATRYLRSVDDAEDVVQDTWLAALAGIERFEGRASLRTWLLRILMYKAQSAARRNARSVPLSQLTGTGAPSQRRSLEPTPFLAVPAPNPEDTLIARDLRHRLERALAELPGRQREVVRLRDLEGWSPDEVCTRMSLTEGNQRVLLHRARSQLRELVVH